MTIQNSVVLVTGANRGIGQAYVKALVEAGAQKIYATARELSSLDETVAIAPDKIIPLALDITNSSQIKKIAQQTTDVEILLNNAGVISSGGLFKPDSLEMAQWEFNTNYFGTLMMIRSFAPILKQNGGGTIVNMLSIASVVNVPIFSSYSASKAALYSLTQGVRAELAAQKTKVIGVFPGPVDTAMTEGLALDKASPLEVAKAVIQGIEQGSEEIYPDATAQGVLENLREPLKAIEQQFSGLLPQ
jgi:NAD(P)-dependent dehydrogenase (short-subunit alcohol dehydrogenase family)